MRTILEDPCAVSPCLAPAMELAERIYATHEAGRPYDDLLSRLSKVVGKALTHFDVCSAFGSVSSETFARGLLVTSESVPTDLSEAEMLELIQRLLTGRHKEFQSSFWIKCLEKNTGNARLSDIIYWPGEYFGDGNNRRVMSAEDVLRTARADRTHTNGT